MEFVTKTKRTHYCGELRKEHVGSEVVLMGWVDTRRDHGGLIFIDLRDREGVAQIVINPDNFPQAKNIRGEYVVGFKGNVIARPDGMVNESLPTGAVEVEVTEMEILSSAETVPFQIGDQKVAEALRLKYRYLDLRGKTLQNNIMTRHKVIQLVREYLSGNKFLEVETPILYKSTPEGARDYLVPSRVNLGHFYALPQSPQTLKQLLMVSGFDRYFQIARCFRDEDLRADRQPEFSQIDIEMSFVDVEDVLSSTEGLLRFIWKSLKGVEVAEIPRLTYSDVMNRFGSDKPDLRIPWELKDLNEIVTNCGFKVFDDVVAKGGAIKGLAVPGLGSYSRGQFDKLTAQAKQMGAKGLVWIKADSEGKLTSPVSKFFSEEKFQEIFKAAGGEAEGAVLVVADDFSVTCASLGFLRTHLAKELNAVDEGKDCFLWVTDFPLFDYDADDARWVACHHPFTHPADEDLETLKNGEESKYGKVKAKAYDLVCNGFELAGGSIRIHNQTMQKEMFKALGLSEEEAKQKFGFFIEALNYGTPPHGGIAWGLDRLVMILCGTEAIRDVIAFPKTAKATCLMSEAPNVVDREQLTELGVRLSGTAEKNLQKDS